MMKHYEGIYQACHKNSLYSVTVQVDLSRLDRIWPILESHIQLAQGYSDGILTLEPSNPYWPYFLVIQKRNPALTPKGVYEMRRRTYESVKVDGVLEPIEVFCDDEGVHYAHGHHRSAFSMQLGLPTIPCTIHACSKNLADLATKIFSIYKEPLKYTTYQPVKHPFFELFPLHECNTCWDGKVKAVTIISCGWDKCIEIGAHFGMLTRAIEQEGTPCLATDLDASYVRLQPMFEKLGLRSIQYDLRSFAQIAEETSVSTNLVVMGLWHHFMGKPDLWGQAQTTILPWMRTHVPEAIVEMSLLDVYQGTDPAVKVVSEEEVVAFWKQHGYDSRLIHAGTMRRHTYHLTVRR